MSPEPQSRQPLRVAVVGGGITGLAAAHRLVELDPGVQVALFERSARLGGVLWTVQEHGFQVEQSADNFITTVPWGLDLCKRLGLGDQLVQTNPACRRTYVVRRGRLCRLPDGFLMMAPTAMWPLAVTPILSPLGKLRAALEYFLPARRGTADESMAGFVRRRLGREVFERLVEPLVSAVYAADMEQLSLLATLPRFREMELQYGSLIRAMRRQRKSAKGGRAAASQSGARYSLFVTLRDGLASLVDALVSRLPPGTVRLQTPVERMARQSDGWWLSPAANSLERFDAVILAAPSHESARLLRPTDAALADDLGRIVHQGTAIVTVAYRRQQIRHPLDGMGFVVPAVERSPFLAGSFSSRKYAHRAPEGTELFRIFVGGARCPEMAEMDDRRLVPLVLGELTRLLGIDGEPIYTTTAHWPCTMPQYHVGHLDLVARIEARRSAIPGLELAGNAFHGVGIPNCIHSGEEAAARILASSPSPSGRGE